ncbi:MAG: Gfo/Idh/MocA family oxidoreductase [Candidatus Latescibacteria bacterium]|nr:Gfo/Idh/MocA family oxidoreductase [Candidatus Latescibacterota bacterium]
MPKGKIVNLALVGCGGIAGAHLSRYETLIDSGENRFRIVAAVDSDISRAKAFADRINAKTGWHVNTYRSVEQLLNSEPNLDGADICSPHGLHHVLGCDLLKGGVNIICEKPIGVTVKASKKIIAAAKRYKKIAANAEQCRRSVGQRTIHWAFDSGLLGTPRMWYAIRSSWEDPADYPNWHWRVDRKLGGCGMVMDSGAHWVDTMRYWFGEIDSVYARVEQMEKRPHRKGDKLVADSREDFWTSIFNFKSGVIGTWSWTISAPGKGFNQLTLSGSKGTIVDSEIFHPSASRANGEAQLLNGITYSMPKIQEMYLETLSKKQKDRLFPYGLTDGMALELWDFIDALSIGRDVEIDAVEGLNSKAVSEAIYESGKSGQVVKVKDVISGKVNAYQKDVDRMWKL